MQVSMQTKMMIHSRSIGKRAGRFEAMPLFMHFVCRELRCLEYV